MDMIAAAALALFPLQVPPQNPKPIQKPTGARAVQSAEASSKRDVIHLVGGEVITGTILKQRGNYIEVRLDEGTVVGFERSRVTSIGKANAGAETEQQPMLAGRDQWFLLHDAAGRSAGFMHGLVQNLEGGGVRVTEEWFFTTGGQGRTQVTILEEADAELRPTKSFYHERVLSAADRLVAERLLDAKVAGPKLVVQRRSLKGRSRQEYPFAVTTRFPLLYREQLRQEGERELIATRQQIFDARDGAFRNWKVAGVPRRKVEWEGRKMTVRELKFERGGAPNTEWIDGEGRTLRREVNGAALVAVATTEQRARRAVVRPGPSGQPGAVAATASGRRAVWLPNPLWRVHRRGADSVVVRAPLYQAEATLIELDAVPRDVQLESAADTLVRWLRLTLGQDLVVRSRTRTQVQRAPAMRISCNWSIDRQGESRPWKGVCHLFRVDGRYVALLCTAPRVGFPGLEGDFRRILDSVQNDPQDIQPVAQGPFAKPQK